MFYIIAHTKKKKTERRCTSYESVLYFVYINIAYQINIIIKIYTNTKEIIFVNK